MKKIYKLLLFFIVLIAFCQVSKAQVENPFLKKNTSKASSYSQDKRTVLIVFDSSRSMEDKIQGETKIHIAKRVLKDVIEKADSDTNIGLRIYGANDPTGNHYLDCSDSKLLVIPNINNRRTIVSEIYKILPRGFTPITFSLSQAAQDLAPYEGEKSIILISDGLETCGGDPCDLAQTLVAAKIDLKIDVVGFGIKDDWEAQEQMKCIALNTKGRYFAAESAEDLSRGLSESINKAVTGRIITKIGKPAEVTTEETEGYENLPMLEPEKLILKRKK